MTPEQAAAYVIAQAASMQAEVAGMQAANEEQRRKGSTPRYTEFDFHNLIDQFGLSHNAVIGLFRSGQ